MSNTKKWIVYLTIAVLVVMRFVYLDQDAPSYMIGGICQEDEQYYALEAINRYNGDNDRLVEGFEHVYAGGLTIYSLPLTYTALKVFGNNYWGFRISVVLISLITILLLYDIIRKLTNNKVLQGLIVLYMFTDFYFFLFSRFQNPQVYSIFSVTLAIWVYFKLSLNSLRGAFWVGFFAIFSVLFVYLYNLFIVGAFGILILYKCYEKKDVKPLLLFTTGAIVSFALYLISLKVIDSPFIENFNLVITHGGGVDSGSKIISSDAGWLMFIKGIYSRLIQLPSTNIFRYNLSAMFLFLLSLPYLFYCAFRLKDERALFYLLYFVFLLIQSSFVLSYPFKKLIIIFPLIVLVFSTFLPNFIKYYSDLRGRSKIALYAYCTLILVLGIINFKLNNSKDYWDGFNYGYYENTTLLFNGINLFLLAITLILVVSMFNKAKIMETRLLFAPSLLGLILVIQYCIVNKTFYSRDGFQMGSAVLNGKRVAMSSCYASQFYTTSKPFMGHYADRLTIGDEAYYYKGDSLFKSGLAEFTIDKIMPNQTSRYSLNEDFQKVLIVPMKYYKFEIYKFSRAEGN